MSRKNRAPKREVLADPLYNSKIVTRLINRVMLDGKRGTAATIVYDAFEQIKVNYSAMAGDLKQIRTEIKTALSGEKIERAAQKIVSEDVDRYKAMLDGHWHNIYRLLEHLEKRIPWNYDIDKRLVKGCV